MNILTKYTFGSLFNTQLWKRSGAWFFKGIPKHTIPNKNTQNNKSSIPQGSNLNNLF